MIEGHLPFKISDIKKTNHMIVKISCFINKMIFDNFRSKQKSNYGLLQQQKRFCYHMDLKKFLIFWIYSQLFLLYEVERWNKNIRLIHEKDLLNSKCLSINNGIFQKHSLSPFLFYRPPILFAWELKTQSMAIKLLLKINHLSTWII